MTMKNVLIVQRKITHYRLAVVKTYIQEQG